MYVFPLIVLHGYKLAYLVEHQAIDPVIKGSSLGFLSIFDSQIGEAEKQARRAVMALRNSRAVASFVLTKHGSLDSHQFDLQLFSLFLSQTSAQALDYLDRLSRLNSSENLLCLTRKHGLIKSVFLHTY